MPGFFSGTPVTTIKSYSLIVNRNLRATRKVCIEVAVLRAVNPGVYGGNDPSDVVDITAQTKHHDLETGLFANGAPHYCTAAIRAILITVRGYLHSRYYSDQYGEGEVNHGDIRLRISFYDHIVIRLVPQNIYRRLRDLEARVNLMDHDACALLLTQIAKDRLTAVHRQIRGEPIIVQLRRQRISCSHRRRRRRF